MYKVVVTKQAIKDFPKLTSIGLDKKIKALTKLLQDNPFQNLSRSDAKWMMDDKNAQIVHDCFIDFFVEHGWKEKLLEYYKGNELPARSVGHLFTTGVQYSVNCKKKTMILEFFEKDNLIFKIDMNTFFNK